MDKQKLEHGLYESVITRALAEQLAALPPNFEVERKELDSEESAFTLALHVTKVLAGTLVGMSGAGKFQQQARLCNQLLALLAKEGTGDSVGADQLIDNLMYLLMIRDPARRRLSRPDTPLANAALFTGTSSDLTLESELKKEIQSADSIDILCSFIKWTGLRLLLPVLREATQDGKRLRVITTSYLGATDLAAIDALQALPNTELRVSYDSKRTRLHAKSYIFHRRSGFGAAYIGSSNISNPALTSGLEWNLKISQYESPYLWEKIEATFETYQHSHEFDCYDVRSRDKLSQALESERGGGNQARDGVLPMLDLDIYAHQQEILDQLMAERLLHHRTRNLVVAATGTGKTMIAAFDFRRLRQETPAARFLYVAHREEILEQSQAKFRMVLRDLNFGGLLVGQAKTTEYEQLFVSIQSLNSQGLCEKLPADYYDYIVVDEFHHAAAASYQRLLTHFQPKVLLGLTATPERHDGLDILSYFDHHIAAEIRLPDAINRKLLVPFHYFGITDLADLSRLKWSRGGYDKAELENMFCGNTQRAALVLGKMRELLLNIATSRCLCFCVSQGHARFMHEYFVSQGLRSEVLDADSPQAVRGTAIQRLEGREINIICVVDLYNEGVDIPSIDTVLFLRPTESLTVFLQQLGRGLRTHEEWDPARKSTVYKECLTVLDFVGNAHRNFNFESRFRALLGTTGNGVADEIKRGFPQLPAGCHISLEKEAQGYILENIKNNIAHARQAMLIQRIGHFEDETGQQLSLAHFIDYHQLGLNAVYKRGFFARLCQLAGRRDDFQAPDEDILRRGILRLLHMNSATQLRSLRELLMAPAERLSRLSTDETRLLTMLHFSLWTTQSGIGSLSESVARLKANGACFSELLEVLDILDERTDLVTAKPVLPYSCPLELHANYSRNDILVALGNWSMSATPDMREGVKYLPDINTDILLVTLNKSEKHYSPTTMYQDYAISDDLFHWQSQSTTSAESPTGQRYLQGSSTVLLFVRENRKTDDGTASYCFLGPADVLSHEGSRPISIVWRLRTPMPARLCRITERMATA